MSERPPRPPRAARWLLTLLLPDGYREAALGDLDEAFARRRERGQTGPGAAWWYWTQVLHVDVWRLRREARREHAHRIVKGEGMMMDASLVELRQALRVFRRSPGFVATAVLTLAVGIGGATAIFSVANALLLRPLPGIAEADRLAVIRTGEYGGAFGVSAYMDYLDFAERSRSFERLAAFKPRVVDASADGAPELINASMVTASYFDVLGLPPHLGRYFEPDVDLGPGEHPVAVLTAGLWERWFARDPDVVGRTMVLNGRTFTVVGVTPEGFRGTELVMVPDVFVPISMQPVLMPGSGYLLDRRGWAGISIVGRLAEGFSAHTAQPEIAGIGAQIVEADPRSAGERTYRIFGFREAALPGDIQGGVEQMSALLLATVAALWLVVCLNVANLFFARSLRRRGELAIRQALGAGRGRLTSVLVLEFMSIAIVAGVAGIMLARAASSWLASLPIPVLVDMSIDWTTIAFAGLLAVMSGLLCATVPALALSGVDPKAATSLTQGRRQGRRRWPSRAMIVSQVTVSVVLLFATGLFIKTLANLTGADPGFESSNVLTAAFDPSLQGYDDARIADFYERLVEQSSAVPGVEAVALAEGLPAVSSFGRDGWFIAGATDPESSTSFYRSVVSPSYFSMLRIPITDGRPFNALGSPDELPELIVNEAGARIIEARTGEPAVGRRMSFSGPQGPFLEVVGVVGDTRSGRTTSAPPFVYASHEQILPLGAGGQSMVVMLKTSVEPASLAGDFGRVAASVDPNVSAGNVITLDRFLDELLAADRLIVTVLGASSTLALLLVAIGVYGLLAYVVTQRTREFGIRVALGAGGAALQAIVVREALALAAVGLALGAAGALVVTRWATGFLVGVSATDPVSLVGGVATVIAVTLASAWVPARRAMRADPVVAMRAE